MQITRDIILSPAYTTLSGLLVLSAIQIESDTDQAGEKRAQRRCPSHRIKTVRKINAGQVSTRNPHQKNRRDIMDKGNARLLITTEISAETKMHRCKDRVKSVGFHISTARCGHRRIFGEKSHQSLRQKLDRKSVV